MRFSSVLLLSLIAISAIAQENSIDTPVKPSRVQEEEVDQDSNSSTSNNEDTPQDITSLHYCRFDTDCLATETCSRDTQECIAKGIFPMTLNELIGSVLIMAVVGVGQAAGVGGGLVVVPLLMQFFQYESKKSIALVFVTIFSASLGNLSVYMRQKDNDGTPIIDYKIVIVSLPTIMIGSVYGVAFNKLLPQSVIAFMLLFFILKTVTKTYRSYQNQKQKELQEQQKINQADIPLTNVLPISIKDNKTLQQKEVFPQPPQTSDLDSKSPNSDFLVPPSENLNIPLLDAHNVQNQFAEEEKQQYPKEILKKIAVITIGFVVFSLLRGGKKFESIIEIPACGFTYQLCNLAALGACFWLVNGIINKIANSDSQKIQKQQRSLSTPEMHKFANSAFSAGLIGSIVGIGGGMILVPKWLEFGVSASKTPACSITLLFLTAFNSLVQFGLAGAFHWEEFIFFSVLAFLSSFLVSASISDYVKRTNQNSLLILVLVFFMVIALVLFLSLTVQQAMTDMSALFVFGEFC